jgi:hypothetical protein
MWCPDMAQRSIKLHHRVHTAGRRLRTFESPLLDAGQSGPHSAHSPDSTSLSHTPTH